MIPVEELLMLPRESVKEEIVSVGQLFALPRHPTNAISN